MKKIKVAALFCAGADGAGGNTYAQQLLKINDPRIQFDVFVNSQNSYLMGANKVTERKDSSFIYFDNYKRLETRLDGYDVMYVVTPPFSNAKDLFQYYKVVNRFTGIKIYFCLDRTIRTVKKITIEKRHLQLFDCVCTWCTKESNIYKYLKENSKRVLGIDFEFFDYNFSNVQHSEKVDVIGFFGRFANFKNWQNIAQDYKNYGETLTDYNIMLMGGAYNFTKTGNLSGTLGMIQDLCVSTKDKTIKEGIRVHKHIREKLEPGMANVYPAVTQKHLFNRMAKVKFCLFPTMYTGRNIGSFKHGLDYTWLESINLGTPIITTKRFGNEFIIDKIPLAHHKGHGFIFIDDFTQINKLCLEYENNYDKNIKRMQKFWQKNYNNAERVSKFIKLIDVIKQHKKQDKQC